MSAHSGSAGRLSRLRHLAGSTPLRVAITVALLGVVCARLDWTTLVSRLQHADVLDLIAAIGMIVAALIIGAYRWRQLLIASGIHLSVSELGRVYAVSTFSGTFLPTTVGGDVTRTLLVARRGPKLRPTIVTVLIDRAAALVGLLGLAWIGVAVTRTHLPRGTIVILGWTTAVFAGGGALAVVLVIRDSPLGRRLVPPRVRAVVGGTRLQVRRCLGQPRLLAVLAMSSLAFQALVAVQLMLLGQAFGVYVSFALAAVSVTLVTVATLAPISIGGFGVREGTYVAILGAVSISATDATLISLMTVVTLFVASLPGAYLLARRGLTPALSEPIAP